MKRKMAFIVEAYSRAALEAVLNKDLDDLQDEGHSIVDIKYVIHDSIFYAMIVCEYEKT